MIDCFVDWKNFSPKFISLFQILIVFGVWLATLELPSVSLAKTQNQSLIVFAKLPRSLGEPKRGPKESKTIHPFHSSNIWVVEQPK